MIGKNYGGTFPNPKNRFCDITETPTHHASSCGTHYRFDEHKNQLYFQYFWRNPLFEFFFRPPFRIRSVPHPIVFHGFLVRFGIQ